MAGPSRTLRVFALLVSAPFYVACDESPAQPPFGGFEITTSAPTTSSALVTADNWSISFERFLVHVSAIAVASVDGVPAATAGPQIVDQGASEPNTLLSATVRSARLWENVSFEVGPAAPAAEGEEIGLGEGVTEADRDRMLRQGLSLYVEATAKREDAVKTLAWGFATDTLHRDCRTSADAPAGLIVRQNGSDVTNIVMSLGPLFADDHTAEGPPLRFDAMAAADADADGIVSLDELRAVPLEVARESGGTYLAGSEEVVDLGAFVEALTRRIVVEFGADRGHCAAEVVVP